MLHFELQHTTFPFDPLLIGIKEGAVGQVSYRNFMPSEYKVGIQNIDFAQNRDMVILW